MKTTFRVGCLAALLPAIALAASPPVTDAKPDASSMLLATPTHLDQSGRIVAPVLINGKGPFRFLIDTGADGSVISPSLVRTLGLVPDPSRTEQVQGTTGIERLPCVTIDDLRIGSIVKHGVHMPISDGPVMVGLDGILGMAGFGPVRVIVNFQSNRVAIDVSNSRGIQGYLDIPARRTTGGLLMIPAQVGDVQVQAVIDTGAAVTLGNTALQQALLRDAQNPASAKIYGVTKQVTSGGISASPTILIGPVVVEHLVIVYSDIPIFKIWHLDSQPALIIGMNVLGSVDALVLDYPRAHVYLRPVAPTGVSVGIEDNSFPIHGVNDVAN